MMKKCPVVLVIFALFISQGDAIAKKIQKVEPYVASFSYTPDSQKAAGTGGVTFTVAGGEFVTRASNPNPWPLAPQFAKLSDALKEDISKLLTAKGFSVRGPFTSYDLIPYSDKKNLDFYVVPTLELSTTFKDTNVKTEGFTKYVYHGTGTIDVSGRLTITLQEVMTREPMWTKNIPISYSFHYDVLFPYFTGAPQPFDMSLIMNDLAKGLEQQYPKTLESLFNIMDPEEVRVIKKQAQEHRKKKGY